MASKLYVGGLSYSTTSETLREYFAQMRQRPIRHGDHRPLFRPVARFRLRRDVDGRGGPERDLRSSTAGSSTAGSITVEISNPQAAARVGGGGGRGGGGGGGRRRGWPTGRARPGRRRSRESGYAHRPSKPVKW